MSTQTAVPVIAATALEQRLLTASLLLAPVLFLAADTTYAARGWDDATAGVLHVLASIGYAFVALRIAAWLPPTASTPSTCHWATPSSSTSRERPT
jgi:hypothetical protein